LIKESERVTPQPLLPLKSPVVSRAFFIHTQRGGTVCHERGHAPRENWDARAPDPVGFFSIQRIRRKVQGLARANP
jgi:hypothetical protein